MESPERKKLIFFAAANPQENPGPAWSAYHFAKVATDTGLEAEVRLAGDAVLVAHLDSLDGPERAVELWEKAKAGVDAPFMVSL